MVFSLRPFEYTRYSGKQIGEAITEKCKMNVTYQEE